jgi:hypothetical protein
MKTTAFACLAGLALVTAARAGISTTVMAPASGGGLWEWFIGGSAGYLTDLEEGMYGLQVGVENQNPGGRVGHAVFLEVGFTQDDADYKLVPPPGVAGGRTEEASIDLDIIPITLNYKCEIAFTNRLNGYVGLGLGVAVVDSSYDWSWIQALPPPNGHKGGSDEQTDVRFYGDVFAGLSYDVSESFELFAGVRYIFMDEDEQDINVTGVSDYNEGINGDVLIELGARYHF